MKLDEYSDKVRCGECKHVFVGKDAVLNKFGTGFSAPFATFIFVEPKTNKMMQGTPRSGDCTLNCPKCGHADLHGFWDKKV
jgi:hypothetical protein